MRYYFSLAFITALIGLSCCSKQPDRSVNNLLDSLSQRNTWFNVTMEVQFLGHAPGHYGVLVKGTLSNGEKKIDVDTIEMLANNKKMDYSVGVGNYYDRYPAFSIDFHEKDRLADTLKFSVRLKGHDYLIGYLPIAAMLDFIRDDALYEDVAIDKTRPAVIDWGGSLPDSLTVGYSVVHKVKNGSNTESSWITQQHWNPSMPFRLTQKIESNDNTEGAFYLTWLKEASGVGVNEKIGCSIQCVGKIEQTMK